MNKKKELLKNTMIIFIGKISTQFLSFFLLPIYTNYLSTRDYGSIDLILTYISLLVPIITIQQEMATFRFLIDARNNEELKGKIISTSFNNSFSYLFVFLFIYLLFNLLIKIKYSYFILINIAICIFSNLLMQISRGLGKNFNYSIASFITGFSTFLLNIILICFCKIGAVGMLLSMSISNIICILYLFFSLKIYRYYKFIKTDKKLKKEMFHYSLPLVPNSISWWFINVSDRTIISAILGVSANGIYAISNKFPSIISSLLGIFSLSWSESASLHIDDKDRDDFFSSVAETVLKLFSCACFGIISILPLIYNKLIGMAYLESYNYIPIFLIGSMANCIVNVYSAIYIAKKMTKKVAYTSIASALINIIINLIFIKFIGLYAASISTALAYIIMMIYRHFDLKKYLRIKYDNKIVFYTIIMFCITITLYYINRVSLNIFNILLVITYTLILNKKNIVLLLKKTKTIIAKGDKNEKEK